MIDTNTFDEETTIHISSAWDSPTGSDIYVRIAGRLSHQIHALAKGHAHDDGTPLRHCMESVMHDALCLHVAEGDELRNVHHDITHVTNLRSSIR